MQVIGDIAYLNAKRYPDKKALIMDDGHLTFHQFNQQVNQLAHGLLSLGIRPEDRVAILAYNCIEYIVIYYAVAKCGGVVVPVNFRYKKDELIYSIINSEPKALFFGSEFTALVNDAEDDFDSSVNLVAISGETLGTGLEMKDLMCANSNQLFERSLQQVLVHLYQRQDERQLLRMCECHLWLLVEK